jgi:hypothetical protein
MWVATTDFPTAASHPFYTRLNRLLSEHGFDDFAAHLYETGGLRRVHVRGRENVLKRLLVHAGAFNLGPWTRPLFGIVTPRAAFRAVWQRLVRCSVRCGASCTTRLHQHGVTLFVHRAQYDGERIYSV